MNFGTSGSLPAEHRKLQNSSLQKLRIFKGVEIKNCVIFWCSTGSEPEVLKFIWYLELNFMTRLKVCEFSNNFQRECKLEVEALYRRTDYNIFGRYLTVKFQSFRKCQNSYFNCYFVIAWFEPEVGFRVDRK